jgi:hypothetical protein
MDGVAWWLGFVNRVAASRSQDESVIIDLVRKPGVRYRRYDEV